MRRLVGGGWPLPVLVTGCARSSREGPLGRCCRGSYPREQALGQARPQNPPLRDQSALITCTRGPKLTAVEGANAGCTQPRNFTVARHRPLGLEHATEKALFLRRGVPAPGEESSVSYLMSPTLLQLRLSLLQPQLFE